MKSGFVWLVFAVICAMPATSFASIGPVAVPEPSTLLLLALGGLGAAAFRRRRRP